MALETLKDVKEIGGFEISRDDDNDKFIALREGSNAIGFKLQNGPIKEVGVNGCQVDTLIEAAKLILEGFNKTHPCFENEQAVASLHIALEWLSDRKRNRMERGVEGTSEV